MSAFGAILFGVILLLIGLYLAIGILFWIGVIVAVIGVLLLIFNGPYPGHRRL